MTTILLDLDNTLLGNDMNEFLPPYFAGLHKHFAKFVDLQTLWQTTMVSVQTIQKTPLERNLLDAFLADFSQRIDLPQSVVQEAWDTFYRTDYPHLKKYTTYRSEAKAVVSHLLADGHQVVIATNPLFPATAIEQRMDWAEISEFSYALVTTMENCHYFKPHPQYYKEILAATNSTPQTTWMVGDDVNNDIDPARDLGLKTWWISENGKETPACDKHGTLSDFLAWIKSGAFK